MRELLEVISVAAHDLKEPLRNLRACADRLARRERKSLSGESSELLAALVSGARHGERLVESLLLYSRVLAKPVRLERIDLEEPLRAALQNLRDRISAEGARVTHGKLPTVRADRVRMIQLFQNLIGNALTYRRESSPSVTIESCAVDRGWLVSVEDSGIGVASRDRERIFEPFARLHPQERYPGSGLGLAICRGIVQGHGGRIWVEASPRGGARFLFTLAAEAEA